VLLRRRGNVMTDAETFAAKIAPAGLRAHLDRLSNLHAAFTRTARKFCDRRGRRNPYQQQLLREQLNKLMDDLIRTYARCERLIDRIASNENGRQPDHEITLYRRAVTIIEIVGPAQAQAIKNIAERERRPW
jgi:hypothetical protein